MYVRRQFQVSLRLPRSLIFSSSFCAVLEKSNRNNESRCTVTKKRAQRTNSETNSRGRGDSSIDLATDVQKYCSSASSSPGICETVRFGRRENRIHFRYCFYCPTPSYDTIVSFFDWDIKRSYEWIFLQKIFSKMIYSKVELFEMFFKRCELSVVGIYYYHFVTN